MQARLTNIEARVKETTEAIMAKDLEKLGAVSEVEAMSLHTVCMMSEPPIYYWNGATVDLMTEVRSWRDQGILAFYTMDAGANVHLITEVQFEDKILELLKNMQSVRQVIVNRPAEGARII
jgi:diphosphomevalonate decarboxylase